MVPSGGLHLHALFGIEPVEDHGCHSRLREAAFQRAVGLELLHGGDVGQRLRCLHQMDQRDQRMRLAAAEGYVQLADGLFRLACQAPGHVAGEITQSHRRIGEGEKLFRVVINTRVVLEHDVVEVSSELLLGKFAALDVGTQTHHLVPGFAACLCHLLCSTRSMPSFRFTQSSNARARASAFATTSAATLPLRLASRACQSRLFT